MKIVWRDNVKSYLSIIALGIIAGASVVFFCEFPGDDLWAFSYWSSETFGFWMFSTSLIVLLSEKRRTAAVNAAIYIFLMFLITTVYKSFRLYWRGYAPFDSLIDLTLNSVYGWLLYSVTPAVVCGVLAAVLWSGRKRGVFGNILCVLPAIFILAEDFILFYSVVVERTKLFSALTDLLCLILYVIFLYVEVVKSHVRT